MSRSRREVLRATGLVAAAGLLAGCQGAGEPTTEPATDREPTPDGGPTTTEGTPAKSATTVAVRDHERYGEILVDADGMTLYLFTQDSPGEPSCYDDCATAWPPLSTPGGVEAGDGVTASLDTVERDDGSMQVTANEWPLYYFASDAEPGDVNGQGLNDAWYVLSPDGTRVTAAGRTTDTTPTTTGESSGGSGYGY